MDKVPFLPFSRVKEGSTIPEALVKLDKALESISNRLDVVEETINQINSRYLQYRRNKKF